MRVQIENFQSIRDADLDCTGLTVIVGPSNYGKSAVLRAIEGALWNRPGDHIVRRGATNASVTITDLPGLGTVTWTKGRVNRYQINGADFTRVGAGAPQPLQEAGYRDVWIGDADKRKGESIRPQVAGQYEPPLFPLTRSGAFLADVLGVMSHHQTVATAQDRCVSDLRATLQLAGVRRADAERLQQTVQDLDAVPLMTQAQRAQINAVRSQIPRVVALRQWLQKRAQLRAVLAAVPAPVDLEAPVYGHIEAATRAVRARALWVRRQALLCVAAPPPVSDTDAWRAAGRTVAGVRRRRLLARVRVVVSPQAADAAVAQVQAHVQTARPLRQACQRRQAVLQDAYDALAVLRAVEVEREVACTQRDQAQAALPRCPTCGQVVSR